MAAHIHPVRLPRVTVCDDDSDATGYVPFDIPIIEDDWAITPIGCLPPDVLQHPAPVSGFVLRVEFEDERLVWIDLNETVQIANLVQGLDSPVVRHFENRVRRRLDLFKFVPPR